MTPDRSGPARPRPQRPRKSRAAVRAARAKPAPEVVDRGSGPPAGSSADVGKPGRLTAPVTAGLDRVDRAAGELAPSAAGRAGFVTDAAGAVAAGAVPATPVEVAGPWVPGSACDPVPEPGSGSSPPGTTGPTSPPTAPVTGASADPTGASADPTGASADPTGASAGPSGRTTAPATGPTTPATGAATPATGLVRVPGTGLAAAPVDRAAVRAAVVAGRVGGATRRTGEVTAGAPRLT